MKGDPKQLRLWRAGSSTSNAWWRTTPRPSPLGAELLEGAREAFIAGLNIAAVFVALAILAVATLRHVSPTGEAQPDQPDSAPAAAPRTDHDPKEVPAQVSD